MRSFILFLTPNSLLLTPNQFVLPKKNRLTKKKEFDLVFRGGRILKNDFLVARFLKNHIPENRFGFIVAKKVSKKGTVRNKVKRQLRYIISQEIRNIKSGIDWIIIAQPGIEKKSFFEIKKALNGFLKRAN